MLSESVIRSLKNIAGSDNVLTSKEDRLCYACDATKQIFLPDAVVFPSDSEEVSKVLSLANTERFNVTPRGAGTGLSGGSIPISGGVVLSLERMRRILRIDTKNLIAVVEPGVVNFELQMELGKSGLFFPSEPTSMRYCTIGGNIANCSGGPRSVKYGVTRDYVLGLEVVLPTGEKMETGTQTVKGVTGYDLTRLIVGSEGTLGIVTKATLRLLPFPRFVNTILAIFDNECAAGNAVVEIMGSGVKPSAVEFMDMASVKCTRESDRFDFQTDNGAVLLIEIDGEIESLERRSGAVSDICLREGAVNVRRVTSKKEVKDIWWLRRAISPSLANIRPDKIVHDIVVPLSSVSEFLQAVRNIERGKGIVIACFGHAGEGNIHVNILLDKNNVEEVGRAEEAADEIMGLTVRLGGSISGEQGIGITRRVYSGMELHPVAVEVMKKIKGVLDPKGILNPGKIFA
ncbi:MAG: FAD-binding protein [Nitrospirae bacterium]|nr:FAD-binding protein [Nitrospirota bacterium]